VLQNAVETKQQEELDSEHSLPESYRSVSVAGGTGIWRFLKFSGPAFLVSVGYMDPGNWATGLEGGSLFGYRLLWVIVLSNLMAMVLQSMCVRMGIVLNKDLAQACRDYYRKPVAMALWILCEIAIIATDVAEVIGSAVALKLLFGLPLWMGVLITGFDVLLLLALTKYGFRKLEALIITLVATIGVCFLINVVVSQPNWAGVFGGMIPKERLTGESLAAAVGILGATVMPHNLYLHSAVIQTRAFEKTPEGKKEAIRNGNIDTVIALGMAFFVNASILILAAAQFHDRGVVVDQLEKAHELLKPVLAGGAATLFAIALLASGQSSTVTGTLAGQVVMEGFTKWRIKPWIRRLITRTIAIVPAMILVTSAHGKSLDGLVVSQIVLALQLPFAVFPLVMITSDKRKMGDLKNPQWMVVCGFIIAAVVTILNVQLLWESKEVGPVAVGIIAVVMILFALWARRFPAPTLTTDPTVNNDSITKSA